MKITFDPAKSERNAAERGLPFDLVSDFDWASAIVKPDTRFAYPEPRFAASGYIGPRIYIVCYTPIAGGVRIISFRKANAREVKRHEHEAPD